MGPLGSRYSKYGVEITDSPYVVVNMKMITRMGTEVLNVMGQDEWYLPCLHSVGAPLEAGQKDVAWPCNPDNTYIALFTDELRYLLLLILIAANNIVFNRHPIY